MFECVVLFVCEWNKCNDVYDGVCVLCVSCLFCVCECVKSYVDVIFCVCGCDCVVKCDVGCVCGVFGCGEGGRRGWWVYVCELEWG